MKKNKERALSRNSKASRLLRVNCGWSQQDLAGALNIDPKTFSEMERNAKGAEVPRKVLDQSARVMGRSEALVDEAFAFDRRGDELRLQGAQGLAAELRNAADRVWTSYARHFREASFAAGHEVTAILERAAAETIWGLYLDLQPAMRRSKLESDPLFHRWGFAERLWLESLSAAADDAKRALELGEHALLVAQRLRGNPAFSSRLQALAWSAVANARRVGSELLQAQKDFAQAKELWEDGEEGDSGILDAARFHALESVLRVEQRRFPEALDCIDAAFSAVRPSDSVIYLFLAKGKILFELQSKREAVKVYREALDLCDASTTPREVFAVHANLVACLLALDKPAEANEKLAQLRDRAIALGNGLDLLRVRWLEGQAHAGLGRRHHAISLLADVRDAFLARGILYDAAQLSLERAALQLEEGTSDEVRAEAPKLAEIFRHLGVAPELLASLKLFWEAAKVEAATAEQARLLLSQLKRAERLPSSRG